MLVPKILIKGLQNTLFYNHTFINTRRFQRRTVIKLTKKQTCLPVKKYQRANLSLLLGSLCQNRPIVQLGEENIDFSVVWEASLLMFFS